MEEPAAEFASSLRDLTTNSKPLITMLTMIAEESKEHAPKIVEAIEDYLRKSESHIKLPSLYLVDSIVKNIGEPYVNLFNENIVRNFLIVFREGDEKVRAALFKLRQTWKDIFTERKLYALDVSTQAVDPNWPVCAAAPIHLNPKFFKTHQESTELEIARKTQSELKSLEQRKRQLEKIQGDLKRKKDLLNQSVNSAPTLQPKQSRDPRLKRDHATTTSTTQTGQEKSEKDAKKPRRSKDRDKTKSDSASRKETSVVEKVKPAEEKKFRIPKKSASSAATSQSQKSSQENQADQSPFQPFKVLEDPDARLMADKEAAAILTGDLDMRIYAPHAKRRREGPSANCDQDFRIRPASDNTPPTRHFEKTETEENAQFFNKADARNEQSVQQVNAQEPEWSSKQPPPQQQQQQPPSQQQQPPQQQPVQGHDSLNAQNGDSAKKFDGPANPTSSGPATFNPPAANGLNSVPFASRLPANSTVAEPAPECGQIRLDGLMREIRFVDGVAIAIMDEVPPNFVSARQVVFRGSSKQIFINDHQAVLAGFDGRDKEFLVNGNRHRIRFGAPLRELYIDDVPYASQFDGRPMLVRSHDDLFTVTLHPPCPTVSNKLDAPPELLAKLGLRPMLLPPVAAMPRGPGPMSGLAPGAGGAGDWRRYDGLPPAPAQGLPPGLFHTPPPPIPPNVALAPGGFMGGMLRPPPFRGPFGGPLLPPMPPPINGFPGGPMQPNQNQQRPQVPAGKMSAGSSANPVNVSDLFHKLLESGMIGKKDENSNDEKTVGSDEVKSEDVKSDGAADKEEIPKLSFKENSVLKQRYGGVISALHEGTQCAACGQRFKRGDSSSDKYAQHLDWHFRMKRRGREGLKKATSRKWYFEISDWIDFEEVEDLEDRAKSFFEQQDSQLDGSSQDSQSSQTVQEVPTVALSALPETFEHSRLSCELCHEVLDKFYCEDSDDWRLRNAVLYDDKLFHPACHEDYLKPTTLSAAVQEERMANEEPQNEAEQPNKGLDESTQALPGLDFQPSLVDEDIDNEQKPQIVVKTEDDQASSADQTEPNDDPMNGDRVKSEPGDIDDETMLDDEDNLAIDALRSAEHEVVIQELGEFGVASVTDEPGLDENNESQMSADPNHTNEATDDVSQPSKPNDKVVVKGSGGFVLKVKQESVANNNNNNNDSGQNSAQNSKDDTEQQDAEIEWTPPTPDPRYKNLPPVKKGSEMSGLCSLM